MGVRLMYNAPGFLRTAFCNLMNAQIDFDALSPADRVQFRTQMLRFREDRMRAWKAGFRQSKAIDALQRFATRDDIEQAHVAVVVMDTVGQPIWTN